jgi:hypothetical protein
MGLSRHRRVKGNSGAFNEMRQDFAAFKKETRMAAWLLDRRMYPNF